MSWIITVIVALIIALIIRTEVVCGRRSKDFLETITPKINQLNDSAARKYRARFGKDPTSQFATVDPDGK